ncbi:MAG: Na(+)/H(+) antiporter subunit B [Rhodobacteraceae bacterium]|nr:Na(+)/H(+) antiporter subunit B [Paracoccaceae bacterium]
MMKHHLILRVITKLLVGPIMLFAFYVQFHGDYSPGGGFQAGVIMAVGIIIYGIVFDMEHAKKVLPPWFVHKMLAFGVLLYTFTGVISFFRGQNFLDYSALSPHSPTHGQHYGILIIELGVGITVSGVMIAVFYAFASRTSEINDAEW